LLNVY